MLPLCLVAATVAGATPATALARNQCCFGGRAAVGVAQISPRQVLPGPLGNSLPAPPGTSSNPDRPFSYVPPAPTNPYQNSGPSGALSPTPVGAQQPYRQWQSAYPASDDQSQPFAGGWNYYSAPVQITCVPDNRQDVCTFSYATPVRPGTRCHCGQYAGTTR
jgi:hypothetical protein